MIVVDASVIVAMVKEEPGHARLREVIAADGCIIAGPSVLEAKMVLSSVTATKHVDDFFRILSSELSLRIIDFTPAMADAAVTAFRTYGKGRGHPAQLNFGDCMAYGVAKVMGASLLYKGDDFALTDIRPALA